MGRQNRKYYGQATLVALWAVLAFSGCTHKVQIEPSDKPFVVNLNVKVDHEIKMKMEDENRDLLNLEQEALPKKSKSGGKKK